MWKKWYNKMKLRVECTKIELLFTVIIVHN